MSSLTSYLLRILFLIRKEILTILKDPKSRAILIAPVIIQAILFGYGATYDLNHARFSVLDLSKSGASRELLKHIEGSEFFQLHSTLANSSQIAEVIDPGKVLFVLSFPADFEQRLTSGKQATVQLILDGRNSSTAGAAAGIIGAMITNFNQFISRTSPNIITSNMPNIAIERRAWYNPNLQSRWQIMPALIAALSMLQTLLLSALSVAREREQGTFDQLLVTPMTPMQILIGKSLPSIFVGLLQSTFILLIIRFWFEVPMNGSPWLLYFGLICFTVAAVGVGMSISAVALNMQQAMLFTFLLIMPLMLLSGLLTPVSNMPEVLQIATYANPLRFGIDLVRRVYLEGAGLQQVAFDFVPMLVLAALTLPLAAWLFRHRLS